jgi:hypothetical protein
MRMTQVTLRAALLAASAFLLAACGGSKTEPVPTPAPVADVPEVASEPAQSDTEAGHEEHYEESAGGGPHVHGLAELAVSREGNRLLGELVSPMANFGLAESDATYTDVVTAELSGLVEIEGGTCDAAAPHPTTNVQAGHTDSIVHFTWTCAKPDDVRAIRFAGFEAFPSFETVNTIYITDTQQRAAELTPSAPELAVK